jgi:copper chaperone CopZ
MTRLFLAACLAITATGCGSAAFAPSSEQLAAATATASFTVTGVTCASCGVTIRTALGHVDGIAEVTVDADAGTATVRYDPGRVTPERIAMAITDAGFPATVIATGASIGPTAGADGAVVASADGARPAAWETIDPTFEGCGGGG